MEKAKRKHSPEIAQKQITRILFWILSISILIFFFPLVWLDSPIKPPLQTYTLLPLLGIPFAIFYGFRYGLRKRDYLVLAFCLVMALLIFLHLAPCPPCGTFGSSYPFDNRTGIVIANTQCSSVFIYCLF